ncbi:uncharacterized protein Tco025E_01524 [Trypanosoma conorhini]|uniref:Uncharacterized protein n=1 Tax=Trypanosoma conorhini TaxID=83891 RepID=A0A3S5IUJ4_9TRYP|nr:uncharacterized protein Tco025E_01524 [Trypanosoma conorhini]RNF26216.1 hypothetical protein Tco025E_01524 [Trypanosoma conorhini]
MKHPSVEPKFAVDVALPSVDTMVCLNVNVTPPHWVDQTPLKEVHETNEARNTECQLVDGMEEDSATGKSENVCNDLSLGPKNEENTSAALATGPLAFPGEHGDKGVCASTDDKSLQRIRSWLLKPLVAQSGPRDKSEESCKETLQRLVEDKIYFYGFYERIERAKPVGAKRPVRRKRGHLGEEAHGPKKHRSSEASVENCGSEEIFFSFPSWKHDIGRPIIEVEKLFSQSLHSAPLLAPGEKQTFSRYALSSGKLRKECADPYQFFTARIHERRQSLEECLSAGEKNDDVKKENV